MDSSQPAASNAVLNSLKVAGLVCLLILAACLLGIITRPLGHLATIWPANALLLGLMVRYPLLAGPAGWIGATAGYVIADTITGGQPLQTLMLTLGNLAGVVSGYLLLSRLSPEHQRLCSPLSVPYFVLAVILAAATSGLVGAVIDPLLFGGQAYTGWAFWFVTELVNYIAVLPVILTFPSLNERLRERRQAVVSLSQRLLRGLPIISLTLSIVLSLTIGGPGALAFPVPALLWCAISYSVFSTALLTLLFSTAVLTAIALGGLPMALFDMNARPVLLSLRLGISLMALAPLTVASIMAARNQLLQRVQYIASHDQLSGLLNRWAFYEKANRLQSKRRKPIALLMFDIDYFKRINDSYGHAAGDLVLKAFSRLASDCLRDGDAMARLGGEEFALLLPDCTPEHAKVVAERIRKAYANESIDLENGQHITSTVSVGVAVTQHVLVDIDSLLLAADRALYQAKDQGRNRVVVNLFSPVEALSSKVA